MSESTASDVVVATLLANGVDVVFALPGEENLPLVSALRRAGVELVVCRHEQHAGFMAAAHARLTGSLAVCLATLGPGALNLFTALAQAQLLSVSVLALTGQKAAIDNDEGSFQVLDVVGAARPLIKFATSVVDPAAVGPTVADAISRALDAPAGAVLVELPEDVAAALLPSPADSTDDPALRPLDRRPPIAPTEAVDALAATIGRAGAPLLLVGSGAANPTAAASLQRLVATSGLSVLTTQMGKGAVPEDHPRSLRALGIHRPDHAHLALDASDLVITIGYQPREHPPLAWQQDRDLPIVHVGAVPAARERGYEPRFEVIGELADLLDRLADRCQPVDTDWSDGARSSINARLQAEQGTSGSVDPLDVVRVTAEVHQPGDVVALDNGAYKVWFARHFPSPDPHALVMDNATASMGAGLAIATAAARLGHRALAVVGDGGLLMNVGDLETAIRLGVDLTVLVLRDDAYGFIAWHQDEQDRARHGVRLTNPDLVTLAGAFGGTGVGVTSVDELRAALEARSPGHGLTLIDCPIDYEINEIL